MLVRAGVSIIAAMIICLILSWKLALTFFAGITPIIIFSVKYADFNRKIGRETSSKKALMSTIADESLSNIRTVKAFANEDEEISKFNKQS
jgi:ABC-type multidrug transport system fused ATPase/permease subunit